jgi:hypothetical protein
MFMSKNGSYLALREHFGEERILKWETEINMTPEMAKNTGAIISPYGYHPKFKRKRISQHYINFSSNCWAVPSLKSVYDRMVAQIEAEEEAQASEHQDKARKMGEMNVWIHQGIILQESQYVIVSLLPYSTNLRAVSRTKLAQMLLQYAEDYNQADPMKDSDTELASCIQL